MSRYPAWICHDCGVKHGRLSPHVATYHIGSACGWCGTTTEAVTEPRDYGYPKAGRQVLSALTDEGENHE